MIVTLIWNNKTYLKLRIYKIQDDILWGNELLIPQRNPGLRQDTKGKTTVFHAVVNFEILGYFASITTGLKKEVDFFQTSGKKTSKIHI